MLDDSQRSSLRRIGGRAAVLLLPLVAISLATPYGLSRWKHHRAAQPAAGFDRPATDEERAAAAKAERKLARLERGWGGASAIVPSEAVADSTGEKVRWFEGFGLSVESTPSGAAVRVNGQPMGQTPLVSSVDCAPGEQVEVVVQRARQQARRRTTTCRKDQLVEMSVDLR